MPPRPHIVAATPRELTHPLLRRLLRRAGLVEEQFTFGTTWQPIPKDATVVVGLGQDTLGAYFPEANNILRWRGRRMELASGKPFVPTFAPSKLLAHRSTGKEKPMRNPPRFQGVAVRDLHFALEQQGKPVQVFDTSRYLLDPNPVEFAAWAERYFAAVAADPTVALSFDIETPYKKKRNDEAEMEESEADGELNATILRVSFCYQPGDAVSVPWTPEYLATCRALLAHAGAKVVWNGMAFDCPVLESIGFAVNGTVFDYMDGWHVLYPDIDKGLEFVSSFFTTIQPWKHLSDAQPQLYSAIDADVALQNAIGIESMLKARGQWTAFMRHSVKLMPILKRAGERGMAINEPYRVELLKELSELETSMIMEVQTLVPKELRPRKVYKKPPFESLATHEWTTPYALVPVLTSGSGLTDIDNPPGPALATRTFERVAAVGKVKRCTACGAEGITKGAHFKGGKKNPCTLAGGAVETVAGHVWEYHELLPFNPNSSDQLKNYMRHFRHPIGETLKADGEVGETADSKHLRKLVKKVGAKHPIYAKTLDIHLVSKARQNVVGLAPDANGKAHTTYVNSPNTWRLGSRNVNVQNQGKRGTNPWAKKSRRCIVASPGHKLVQADSSSIEAVDVGWFMGDQNYINLAKRSIHAYLACQKLGIAFTQENVAVVKKEHKMLYDQMKFANHSTNYGTTPFTMVETFPDIFPTQKVARETQDFIFDAVPGLRQWHHDVRAQAQKDACLKSPWGHALQFYDVFTRYPSGEVKLGKDRNRAIAYKPQNAAGCFMRDNLLIMGTETPDEYCPVADLSLYGARWEPYMPANVSVHDGYTLDVPEPLVEEAVDYLGRLLTRPIHEMGGLQVGCEIEVGDNWLDMETVKVITTLEGEQMQEAA